MAKRWYIIHAYSNFENKVADSIREQAKHRHLDYLFEDIIVPTEKLVDVRHGQKHTTERKFFPGYVLAKMELTDEVYHLIKNTPKVSGFLGAHKKRAAASPAPGSGTPKAPPASTPCRNSFDAPIVSAEPGANVLALG